MALVGLVLTIVPAVEAVKNLFSTFRRHKFASLAQSTPVPAPEGPINPAACRGSIIRCENRRRRRTTTLPVPRADERQRYSGLKRLARGARITHPFPTLLNVAATCGLAFVAARGAPDGSLLARMLLLMFFAQSAIGIVNDLCDRDLDAATKPWKPIPAEIVPPGVAVGLSLVFVGVVIGLGATLGGAGFALAMLGLGCGLAYDVKLKRSAFSAVPYMIAIPTLPLWVWATLGEWRPALWWLLPIGALIGLALHLQNTLPDIDDDASNGVSGLAHRLGASRSMVVAWASFAVAIVVTALLAPELDYDLPAYVGGAGVAATCLVLSVAAYFVRRDPASLQVGFGLLGVGSAVLATGWLAAVT